MHWACNDRESRLVLDFPLSGHILPQNAVTDGCMAAKSRPANLGHSQGWDSHVLRLDSFFLQSSQGLPDSSPLSWRLCGPHFWGGGSCCLLKSKALSGWGAGCRAMRRGKPCRDGTIFLSQNVINQLHPKTWNRCFYN